jgi:radical SAM superfamily enzyme YgiQ (UPF0313 family)
MSSSSILLVAVNARYAHASFGARYLLANLGDLQEQAQLLEFDLKVQPRVAVEKILEQNPRIVAIGCYIWNIDLVTRLAALLKTLRPDIKLVLGGPEVSYETEVQEIFQYADHVICGEGEKEFPILCQKLLNATASPKIIYAEPVDLAQITLPYELYSSEDLAHRVLYVEASRDCPFRCEYCMSSLDATVRYIPEEPFFAALKQLVQRGARRFKFVDRTFNLDMDRALRILDFFQQHFVEGMHVHFELVPDRFPEPLFQAVCALPPDLLQFEIGIQTFNSDVAKRIERPLDVQCVEKNLRRLRKETTAHLHVDLIAGLPGEDLESFETGFNRLLALRPQEIQLGILKRLRGTAISRHTQKWKMVYSPHAPYEILQTAQISFSEMQRVSRFARYWELVVNSGRFPQSAPLIWKEAASPFSAFMAWSDWLYARTQATAHLHFLRLMRLLLEYLVKERNLPKSLVIPYLRADYQAGGRPDLPAFLRAD